MNNFFNFQSKKRGFICVKPLDAQMSIIKRLGKPRFWVSQSDFFEIMDKIYKTASESALKYYGTQKPKSTDEEYPS